ncbi:MAG: EamA family transporter [Endomicrobiales bacterium]|jgi:transporter family protein
MIIKQENLWWLYAISSAFFAALTAILAKVGIKGVNADLATAIRTVVILLVAWGIFFIRHDISSVGDLSKRNIVFLILSGLATGLSWIFYFRALQLGKVSQVASVDRSSLAIAIILSIVVLQETITLQMLMGIVLIITGTIIVIL